MAQQRYYKACCSELYKSTTLKYLVAEDKRYCKFYPENLVLDFPACNYSLKDKNSFYKR